MRLHSKVFVAGLLIASAALVMQAQSVTNLSGTWKMNAAQSRFSDPKNDHECSRFEPGG